VIAALLDLQEGAGAAFDGVDVEAALDYLVMAYGAELTDIDALTGAPVRS
jgi:hypothetical protein